MIWITILCYSTGEIFIHHVCETTVEDHIEDYLSDKGYNLDEISYMVSDDLNLRIL